MTKLSIQPWLLCLTIITFLLELGYKVLEKKVILIVSRVYSKNTYIQTIRSYEEQSQYLNWFIFSDHVVPPPSINPNLSSQRSTKAFLLTQIFPISYPSVLLTRSSHGYFVSRNKSSISSGPCCNILDGTLFTAFCACRFDSTLQVYI